MAYYETKTKNGKTTWTKKEGRRPGSKNLRVRKDKTGREKVYFYITASEKVVLKAALSGLRESQVKS